MSSPWEPAISQAMQRHGGSNRSIPKTQAGPRSTVGRMNFRPPKHRAGCKRSRFIGETRKSGVPRDSRRGLNRDPIAARGEIRRRIVSDC